MVRNDENLHGADSSVREQMIDSTMRLLAAEGVAGASFGAVTKASNTPRGSIYHYFPQGKNQLVSEALTRACEGMDRQLAERPIETPTDVVTTFMDVWHTVLQVTDFDMGCSVAGVTLSTSDQNLLDQANWIFDHWIDVLVERFTSVGLDTEHARRAANVLLALAEGGVVMSRAARSSAPLDYISATAKDWVIESTREPDLAQTA